jgi:hypothetical protein
MKKRRKSREDPLGLGALFFICVLGASYYQWGALNELVKCRSSKNFIEPISLKNTDISGFLAGF